MNVAQVRWQLHHLSDVVTAPLLSNWMRALHTRYLNIDRSQLEEYPKYQFVICEALCQTKL
jgi:hypothetical protein